MKTTVIYPGTFDPITQGHRDVLELCGKLFDKVIVVMGKNIKKKTMFTEDERLRMLEDVIKEDLTHPELFQIYQHAGLIADLKHHFNPAVAAIVRGVRYPSEYEAELNVAFNNDQLGDIPTILIPPKQEHIHISSSAVREILEFDTYLDRVEDYLCPSTIKYIKIRFRQEG